VLEAAKSYAGDSVDPAVSADAQSRRGRFVGSRGSNLRLRVADAKDAASESSRRSRRRMPSAGVFPSREPNVARGEPDGAHLPSSRVNRRRRILASRVLGVTRVFAGEVRVSPTRQ
jgi:hypothetical protein